MKKLLVILTVLHTHYGFSQIHRNNSESGRIEEESSVKTVNRRGIRETDCNNDLELDGKKVYKQGTSLPFTGKCTSYFEDGSIEREANFVDGKEDGFIIEYYKNKLNTPKTALKDLQPNMMKLRMSYKLGVEDGQWQFWYENGKLAWEMNYVDGKKHGEQKYYYENGNPKKIEIYNMDVKHGLFTDYYPDSTLKAEIEFKNGYFDGKYILYYSNGQEQIKATMKQGKEEGEKTTYHPNGQMATLQKFVKGKPEGTWRSWYDTGTERSVERYVKGVKEGEQTEYHKEGQLKMRAVYKAGKLVSEEFYDEFGNKYNPRKKGSEEEDNE